MPLNCVCDMTDSYVRDHSFVRAISLNCAYKSVNSIITATWLVHTCDMTHSCVHDLYICSLTVGTSLKKYFVCNAWEMARSYVCHDSFIRAIWRVHMCNMTHSYVRHDSLKKCDMTHSYVWHDYRVDTCSRLLTILSLFCKTALWKRPYSAKETYNFKEPTTRSHPILVRHDWTMCVRCDWTMHVLGIWGARNSTTYMHNMTFSYVRHDQCDMTHCICGKWLIQMSHCCATLLIHTLGVWGALELRSQCLSIRMFLAPLDEIHFFFWKKFSLSGTMQRYSIMYVTKDILILKTPSHYNTLQHTAIHCNTLQHTVIHCNALQHTMTHSDG